MDPSFVLPARAQMQALFLQHEVRYDVQLSTSLIWDPRLESSSEEAIYVMPRVLAESAVGPVFQSSRLPDASDETGRQKRVGQGRVGHGNGRPAEQREAEACVCTVDFASFSVAERPFLHRKVRFGDVIQVEVATFRPGDRLPPFSQSQRVQHRVASTAPALRLAAFQVCCSSGQAAGPHQLSLSQHVPPLGVCTALSSEFKDGSMSNLARSLPCLSDSAEVFDKPHGQMNQCFDTPCYAPLVPPDGSRSKVARGALLRRPGSIALLRADSVAVFPIDKRAAPIFEGPLSRFSWGGQSGSDAATVFTIFDHVRHVLVEKCASGASLHDVVALAISDAPFQVGAIQVLSDVLPGLPALQIVLSELRRPVDELPIPWDFRQIGEPIKTVRHRALQASPDALLDAQQLLHSPRDLADEVAAGVVVVQDAIGALRPTLPRALEEVQFFRVCLSVIEGWAHDTELEHSTTTTSFFDEELLTRPVRRPRYLEGVEVIPRRILVAPAAHLPASSLGLFPHFRREGASAAPYHLLLRGFHPLRRMGQSRWTLMDFCDHAAMDINGSVRCVQVLATSIPGLLQPQIVVTAEADDASAVLLPIDMRAGPGGEVVPVMLRPGSRFEGIVAAIDAELPGSRDFFDGLGDARHCHFVDSQGLLVEVLPADPRCLQWLELRPTAPPFLERSATTVTSTGAVAACLDSCWHDVEVSWPQPHRLPVHDMPEDRDPPNLLRLGSDRSDRPKQCPPDWHLQPTTLRAYRDDRVCLKSWGAVEPETRHLFTVFDTVRHCTVVTADGAVSVADFAHRAAATAPRHVRSIQFLTAPVAGYPLPQVVLTFDNDGSHALAVPWDGRSAGLPIRTVAHQPGEGLLPAARAYQRAQPMARRFEVMVQNGLFAILDVAGVIDSALPLDLTEIQFLRIETRHSAGGAPSALDADTLDGGVAGLFQGYGVSGLASVSSTTTTTQPTTFRLRLMYRGHEAWRDVLRPCVQLDLHVEAMLHELATAGCIPAGPISITLAKAHPPPADFLQEVLFLVMPYDDFPAVQAVFDSRMQGGHIAADAVPEGVSVDQAVSAEWRRMGFFSLVNGAPEQLVDRPIGHGDYLQVGHVASTILHTAASEVMDQLPNLEAYGWPIEARTRNNEGSFVARIRERRRRLRVWLPTEALCTILGPTHGPVRFRLEHESVPSVAELRLELTRLPDYNSLRLALAHTVQLVPGSALFVSVAPSSDARTVLLPKTAVRSCSHYVVLMVHHRMDNLGWLPLEPTSRIVWPAGRWMHGHILSLVVVPAHMGRAILQHVRPPPPAQQRPTLSPSGRVVPRSGTSMIQLTTAAAEQARLERRCKEAARAWGVSPDEPCIQGLPSSVHASLEHEGPGVSKQLLNIPTPLGRRALRPVPAALTRDSKATGCTSCVAPPPCRSIVLDEAVPSEALAPCAPPGPRLCLGVTAEMYDTVFEAYGLELFERPLPDGPDLPPQLGRFLQGLPVLSSVEFDAVQIYTDGAYFPGTCQQEPRAGCALCLLVRQSGAWNWAGSFATMLPISGSAATVGVPVSSSFEPELAALVVALAVIVRLQVPALIGFDNQAAMGVALGNACPKVSTSLASTALALSHLLRLQGRAPATLHIPSHTGHPLNETADFLAKRAARLGTSPTAPDCLHVAQMQNVLPWLWLWVACSMCPSVPRPSETGVLTSTVAPERGLSLAACADFRQESAHAEVEVSCALATYNCLTCVSVLQQENLDFQFHAESLCVVGLQETRADPLPRSASAHFHILSGPSEGGQLGCQLWLARHCPVGFAAREPVHWNPSSFSILSAAPRYLLATASAAGLKFAFLVAHALTAHAGPAAIRDWWQQLSTLVSRVPPQHALILLLDANAHFEWSTQPPDVERAQNPNAKEFASFLREHGLSASPNMTAAGKKVESWLGPMGPLYSSKYNCRGRPRPCGVVVELHPSQNRVSLWLPKRDGVACCFMRHQ